MLLLNFVYFILKEDKKYSFLRKRWYLCYPFATILFGIAIAGIIITIKNISDASKGIVIEKAS